MIKGLSPKPPAVRCTFWTIYTRMLHRLLLRPDLPMNNAAAPRRAGIGRTRTGVAIVCLAALMLVGCTQKSAPDSSPGSADTIASSVPDTVTSATPDTAAADTVQTASGSTSALHPESEKSAASAQDSPPTAAVVPNDSDRIALLIEQVANLRAEVARLSRPRQNGRADAPADTARTSARERVKETAQDVQNFGLRAFWTVVIITAAFFLIKFIVWILEALSERSARRRLFFKKLIPITRILVWIVVGYYTVAGVFEVDRNGLLAAGAAVGVAVGFAAQDVLKNIFGGILIILDQPFQVGDRVRVGGTYGEVVSIGLRSTRIVTPDDNLVSVPNTQVVDGQVANANAGALDCQVVTELYLPGWVDVARAKEIAYDAAANSKFVFLKKPIVVLVQDEFKETFLTRIVVKAYVIDARYEGLFASDVTETAKMQYLHEGMLAEFFPGVTSAADMNVKEDLSGDRL